MTLNLVRPLLAGFLALAPVALASVSVFAQDRLPWQGGGARPDDAYRQDPPADNYDRPPAQRGDAYRPPAGAVQDSYRPSDAYRPAPAGPSYVDNYRSGQGYQGEQPGYGQPYEPAPGERWERDDRGGGSGYERGPQREYGAPPSSGGVGGTYSQSEILNTGHSFFGSISQGLASVIEYAFQQSGRPNGYILGEDAGGAFVAGLRYGEGTLFTKDAGNHRVYWQGPSLGYDFGAEGSKTMVLVYNLRDPSDVYHRFGGVQGSAYLVGGVSIQFQKHGDVVLAPIRSGVGLRLGANVGYLKYTRSPTWNPF